MLGLEGRVVVVTGGTGALGVAVVRAFLDAGAHCHVPALEAGLDAHFPFAGDDRVVLTGGVDLTDDAAVAAYYAARPDLYASVHLAGGFAMAPLSATTKADLMQMVSMNLVTAFLCSREASRQMQAAGRADGGRIVNVAAKAGVDAINGAGMAAYAASKAAVAALTRSLGQELAGKDILVNAIAPSIMDTPANRASMPKADHSRWPKVDEVARTVRFLASPQNAVTRGAVLEVYGQT